jgi:hypothetical protein
MCTRWQAATGEWCRLAAERTHIGRNKKSPAAVPGFQVHSPTVNLCARISATRKVVNHGKTGAQNGAKFKLTPMFDIRGP